MLYDVIKAEIGTIIEALAAAKADGTVSNWEKLKLNTTLAGSLTRLSEAIPADETQRRQVLTEASQQFFAEHIGPLIAANVKPITLSVLDRLKET